MSPDSEDLWRRWSRDGGAGIQEVIATGCEDRRVNRDDTSVGSMSAGDAFSDDHQVKSLDPK